MQKINVSVLVNAPLDQVWKRWTEPEFIVQWNHASDDWCCPRATNDLSIDGTFNYRMEAVDGSFGFDFEGTYIGLIPFEKIEYTLGDDRRVTIEFINEDDTILVSETFDTEDENTAEKQRYGWQCILDNFKKVAEQ